MRTASAVMTRQMRCANIKLAERAFAGRLAGLIIFLPSTDTHAHTSHLNIVPFPGSQFGQVGNVISSIKTRFVLGWLWRNRSNVPANINHQHTIN